MARWWSRPTWDGTDGAPRSSNAASSFHLFWDAPGGDWIGAEATLEIVEPPFVPRLYFWAMQVSFTDRGRRGGGAHLGLQWHAPHPGSTAVNWGGYGPGGGELDGSASALPSGANNVNTRDYPWQPRRRYRLRVRPGDQPAPAGLHAWRGEVVDEATGETTVVRELWAAGDRIEAPMVWSEVFADCDAPGVVVRWSDLVLLGADGSSFVVRAARVNYQALGDGGCSTTNSTVEADAFVQTTSAQRSTSQGARLVLG